MALNMWICVIQLLCGTVLCVNHICAVQNMHRSATHLFKLTAGSFQLLLLFAQFVSLLLMWVQKAIWSNVWEILLRQSISSFWYQLTLSQLHCPHPQVSACRWLAHLLKSSVEFVKTLSIVTTEPLLWLCSHDVQLFHFVFLRTTEIVIHNVWSTLKTYSVPSLDSSFQIWS